MDHFCRDVVDSSWLSCLQWLYCSLHFYAKDGVVILCVCLGTVQYWWISIGLVAVQLRAVFCPLVQYLSLFCEAFSWMILDSSCFPLFLGGQVFTSWYALLLLFFLRFSSISLHCSPIQFSLAFFMHLLMLSFPSLYFSDPLGSNLSFLSSLLLSHRSRILQWPRFFSSDDVCQRSHLLFQSLLCWRWW